MNAIGDNMPEDAAGLCSAAAMQGFTVRRTGRKPMRFEGWLLVEAQTPPDSGALHHDLRLYRTARGAIVAELVTHREGLSAPDVERVESMPDLPAAADWLMGYRCVADLPVPERLTAPETPLALAALHAVSLRQSSARVQDEYDSLLSDVFAALDITETLETAGEG